MFDPPPPLRKPGLFVTATDTDVGKTLAACAIAWALRQQKPGCRVGVCKPMATGCRRDREGLVSEDAEALAHFADCRQVLDVINPVRFVPPVAPAVAAELRKQPMDFAAIARSLSVIDRDSDFMLIEGAGGILVPIDPADAKVTMLDLIGALGYPALIVCRATLGTLNHTAMTVRLLRQAGCSVAGLVISGHVADSSTTADKATDLAMFTNRSWLMKMTGQPILATLPLCPTEQVQPHKGLIAPAILEAAALTFWPDVLARPRVKG